MTPLLSVRDLSVRFDSADGPVQAVSGVSFDLEPGGALGIVGESGSGKTVAALTVLGLTRSSGAAIAGQVLLDGRDLVAARESDLRRVRGGEVAMIFQDPLSALHPLKRVGAQVAEAVRAHAAVGRAAARGRAVDLLAAAELPDPERAARAWPHELSGGMRQRALIAMALAGDPRILIADEPTTALDVTVQAQILGLLRRLRDDRGMALVLISHDLGVVGQMADEIAVMYAGRIVEHAPAGALFAAPHHPYTWGLLRSIPRVDLPRDAELVPIPGRPPSLVDPPPGCSFHPRCPYVRDRHRHVVPQLEPLPDDPRHRVACLLDPATRRELWEGGRP